MKRKPNPGAHWECKLRDLPPAWQTMRRFVVTFRDGTEIDVDYLFPGIRYPVEQLDYRFWCAFEFHGDAISETGFYSGWGYVPTVHTPSDLQYLPTSPEEYVTPLLLRILEERAAKSNSRRKASTAPNPDRALACYTFVREYARIEDSYDAEEMDYLARHGFLERDSLPAAPPFNTPMQLELWK